MTRLTHLTAAALILASLTACSTSYVRVGDRCEQIGAEARTKRGTPVICKAPRRDDPTASPRWRYA